MFYCILCIITYIISYPVPILCLLPCSGYTPMLYYSFLTYCFIMYCSFHILFSCYTFHSSLSYLYHRIRSYSIYHILCAFVYFHYFSCVHILIFISIYTVLLVLVTVYYHRIARLCFSYHIIYFAFTFPLCILFIFSYIHACKYLRSGFGK